MMSVSEGQRLGNYRLHRLLGKGSFAAVYLAEHLYLNTPAAIKVLHTVLDEEDERLFLTEAQTIARLAHPNIVRVREFAIDRSTPFLVMDYVPGGTLRRRYPRGTCLSLEQTVTCVTQIAAALQYAHNQGIVHRDVKPENVLQGAGQVMLSDFGISVSIPKSSSTGASQSGAGTLPYMAPEQFQGQAVFASDQYALAIMAYEWLCGVRPFEGSGTALALQHVHLPPPPLRDKDPSLPEAVEAVILKALSKRPEQRYVSILGFARALERASRTESSDAIGAGSETELPEGEHPARARHIFLSHADQDDVTRLSQDLALRDFAGQDTDVTVEQEEQIRQAIRAAQAILVLLTPHTRASAAVQEHLRITQLYRRRIICLWTQGKALQDLLPAGAQQSTMLDARDGRYTQALDELVHTIDEEQQGALASATPFPDLDFEPRNPYKGLRAFTQEDHADFFGRHALVHELLAQLREQMSGSASSSESNGPRFLAVIGPSGSGKSSAVMAGLLPRLQKGDLPGSEHWLYLDPLVPDTQPLEALALQLAPYCLEKDPQAVREILRKEGGFGLHQLSLDLVSQPGMRVVLMIDQFEELFSPDIPEPERRHLIELLVTAASEPRGPVLVLLTLRADFYDRPFAYPALGRLIQQQQCAVLPMSLDDLREVIERPALLHDVRLTFDEDLVGDLLFDMRGQPGALPLLEFALEQLFHHRRDHRLTRYAYQEIGGVRGALSQHAEATYTALPSEEHRQLARTLFLRLVQPGGQGQDPLRRRADASEFLLERAEHTQALRQVSDAFTSARLITSIRVMGTPTLEISHEALLREWSRLARWVREAREDMQLQQAISHDVREWERRNKPKDRLYRGSQLKESLTWRERNTTSGAEAAFLRASLTRRTRTRISLALVALLLLAILIPTGLILEQQFTPLTVTTLKDDGPGSLRQAIDNTRSGGTILIDAHLKGTLVLNRALIINKNVTIRAAQANQITIRGTRDPGGLGLVQVQPHATVTLSQLTFRDPTPQRGSVITNNGTLTLDRCSLIDNVQQGVNLKLGDANGNDPQTNYGGGGAITNAGGTLILQQSLIAHNTVHAGNSQGGGITNGPGTLIINNSQIVDNTVIASGQSAEGGGIYSIKGQVTLINSTVTGNSAIGGSILNAGGGLYGQQSRLMISHSTISHNSVEANKGQDYAAGGGIASVGSVTGIDESHLEANTVINNATSDKAFAIGAAIYTQNAISANQVVDTSNVTMTSSILSNNTITANTAAARGGAIAAVSGSLTLNKITVENNRLTSLKGLAGGGGIYSGATLTITSSAISNNSATAPSNQYGSIGGGIDTAGTLTLQESSIAQNTISSQGVTAGGGIYAENAADPATRIRLTNCTIADNQVQGPDGIGGAFATDLTPIMTSIDFCTIARNSASRRAGGIDADHATTAAANHLLLKNSIVVDNKAPTDPDISRAFITGGYNLVQNWGSALVIDAQHLHKTDRSVKQFAQAGIATQLRINGEGTPTLALQAGSPAINAIPAAACDVTIDQRGVKRPQQRTCDIGAYEHS